MSPGSLPILIPNLFKKYMLVPTKSKNNPEYIKYLAIDEESIYLQLELQHRFKLLAAVASSTLATGVL